MGRGLRHRNAAADFALEYSGIQLCGNLLRHFQHLPVQSEPGAELVQQDTQYPQPGIVITLRDAKVGDTVTVVKLHGEGAVKRRIMDMGITKGVALHVRKVAPLGDPMELNVRGYELSVRKADAEMIEIA